jgi:hypothetical protein
MPKFLLRREKYLSLLENSAPSGHEVLLRGRAKTEAPVG